MGDTTTVFSFHSNFTTQDTHSIRRCLTHVLQYLIDAGHLDDTAHLWQDGSGAQNKGRKAFRQMSELSMQLLVNILSNFAIISPGPGTQKEDVTIVP